MSGARELAAAGIVEPRLRESYALCRELNASSGKTYFLATFLLPPAKRPYVHALYAFARFADDIVDDPDRDRETAALQLKEWGDAFHIALAQGHSDDPLHRAVVDTIRRWDIPTEYFDAFLTSMAMDLTVTDYATYEDLLVYVHGSASVVGEQMVPILEPIDPRATTYARELGTAFQLANFIRDIAEDLDLGRVYLPTEDLERFGLTRQDLEKRVVDSRIRDLLRFEIARVRRLERAARPGIAMLHPTSQPCIEAARIMYCGIVDEVERIDYEVFTTRATVPLRRRIAVAGPAFIKTHAPKRPPRKGL